MFFLRENHDGHALNTRAIRLAKRKSHLQSANSFYTVLSFKKKVPKQTN